MKKKIEGCRNGQVGVPVQALAIVVEMDRKGSPLHCTFVVFTELGKE